VKNPGSLNPTRMEQEAARVRAQADRVAAPWNRYQGCSRKAERFRRG